MNDEIKEILDMFTKYKDDWYSCEYKLKPKQCVTLYDYITNLQQDNTMYAQLKDEYEEEIKDLQQENERLKDIVVEKDNQIKEMILQKTDYTDVNILEMELEDYKSRCEKASECIKKDTRWFDSEYASIYGELCDCAGAKGDRLEVMVNPSNALNILQNGVIINE